MVYILKENSLSTYFDSSSLDTDEIKKISVKELFAHDEKVLQRNYPQMKRDFGEKRYAEGLFLSFVNEPFIKQVTLVVTNAKKLESYVRKASNPRGNESVFILYPFEEIATRYISLDFRSLDCVVLNRYSLERYNEYEWCDFLYHFQRYIKFFCDCDILSISEEDSEK